MRTGEGAATRAESEAMVRGGIVPVRVRKGFQLHLRQSQAIV